MTVFFKFLFPSKPDNTAASLILLVLRIFFGGLLMFHGEQKLIVFSTLAPDFPDPLGVGSHLSLGLAVFGEFVCGIGCVVGAFYRLAMIPMIFTMCIAFFVVHANDPFSVKELPFVYLVVFIIMYIAGPGKYSLDALIAKVLHKKQQQKHI